MLEAIWTSTLLSARLRDDDFLASLRLVDDWFEPGERSARRAWVVEWMEPGLNTAQRRLVELDSSQVLDDERRAELVTRAVAVTQLGEPMLPPAFGMASTDMHTTTGLQARIEVASHGLQGAQFRLSEATRVIEEWGSTRVAIALTETLAWLRGFDEIATYAWKQLPEHVRQEASRRVDVFIAEHPTAAAYVNDVESVRQRTGRPYSDWTVLLVDRGLDLPRSELQGLRWLAGKLLHMGPLPATELRHWRAGTEPRWKWRPAEDICPADLDRFPKERAHYENSLVGRDVNGTLTVTMMMIESEHLFGRMIREAAALRADARDEDEDHA